MAVRFLLGVSLVLLPCLSQIFGKEHKLTIHKFEKIREDEHALQSELRLGKPNEQGHIQISGELKQHVPIDNEWKLHLVVHRASSPNDKFLVFLKLTQLDVCEVMKTYYKQFFYESLKEYSNAPHPDTCPLPPENYYLKDYPFDLDSLKKFLIPGYYRIEVQLLKLDEIKLEYVIEMQDE